MNLYSFAIKNLIRRPARVAAMVAGMAAISATAFSLLAVHAIGAKGIREGLLRLGADAIAVPSGQTGRRAGGVLLMGGRGAQYMDEATASSLGRDEDVEAASSQLFILSAPLDCCSLSDTSLIGFEPGRDFTITPWLREALGRELSDDEIVIGSSILSEPGGRMTFYSHTFKVAGKLDRTGIGHVDSSVFIPMPAARRMIVDYDAEAEARGRQPLGIGPDKVSAVTLRFKRGVLTDVTALMIEYEHPGLEVVLASEVVKSTKAVLMRPLRAAFASAAIQWAAGLILIGAFYGLWLGERQRETALIRAMGARPADLRRMFVCETVLMSLLGGLAGVAVGLIVVSFVRKRGWVSGAELSSMELSLYGASVIAMAVLMGIAATAYPALMRVRALRRDPASGLK